MSSENDKKDNDTGALFAILFTQGEPVKIKKIADALNKNEDEVNKIIDKLEDKLSEDWSGIMLINQNDEVSLASKSNFAGLIEKFIKVESKQELTKASLETLSIISYFAPIPRSKIDYIRGVNSTYILRSLLIRGLIERNFIKGQYVYSPSTNLLRYLGISNIKDLPGFEKRKNLSDTFFKEWMEEDENKVELNDNINL